MESGRRYQTNEYIAGRYWYPPVHVARTSPRTSAARARLEPGVVIYEMLADACR